MRRLGATVTLTLASFGIQAQGELYDELARYYRDNLPSESFLPTPYGADDRFSPKSIWIYLEDMSRNARARTRSGWVVASSGAGVYPEEYVQTKHAAVVLPTRSASADVKWGIAAALSGTLSDEEVEAGIELARQRGLEVSVELGAVEIEYVYYFDMLIAQAATSIQRGELVDLIRQSNDGEVPTMRVILGALRARDSTISVEATSDFDGNITGAIASLLSKLGVSFNRDTRTFDVIRLEDWRYIAYQSKVADAALAINSGEGVEAVDESPAATATLEEQFRFLFAN